jgi:hypothetical protein
MRVSLVPIVTACASKLVLLVRGALSLETASPLLGSYSKLLVRVMLLVCDQASWGMLSRQMSRQAQARIMAAPSPL